MSDSPLGPLCFSLRIFARRGLSSLATFIIALAVIAPTVVMAGDGQWTSNGPFIGRSPLDVNPADADVLYASAFGPEPGSTVYPARSLDGGQSWTILPEIETNAGITEIAADPHRTGGAYSWSGGTIYHSTDHGDTWTQMGEAPSLSDPTLAVSPHTQDVLYLTGDENFINDGKVYKSTNGGASFTDVDDDIPQDRIEHLVFHDTEAGTLYAATWSGVYKTTNGGTSWTALNTGLTNDRVEGLVRIAGTGTLLAATPTEIFRSTNDGVAWGPVHTFADITSITGQTVDADGNGYFSVFDDPTSQILMTANDGAQFNSVTDTITSQALFTELGASATTPAMVVANGGNAGLVRTTDAGQTWTTLSSGTGNAEITDILVHPDDPTTLFASGQARSHGVFRSTDGGQTWTNVLALSAVDAEIEIGAMSIDPASPTNVFALSAQEKVIFRSTDGGDSWELFELLPQNSAANMGPLAIDPATPQTLYAGVGDSINGMVLQKSTDSGENWAASDNGLGVNNPHDLAIDPTEPNILFAAAGEIFRSGNSGASWQQVFSQDNSVESLAIIPGASAGDSSQTRASNVILAGDSGTSALFKSTNGGVTWTESDQGLGTGQVRALAVDPTSASTVYAGQNGTWVSTDQGDTWTSLDDGQLNPDARAIAVGVNGSNRTIYVGTQATGVQEYSEPLPVPAMGGAVIALLIGMLGTAMAIAYRDRRPGLVVTSKR